VTIPSVFNYFKRPEYVFRPRQVLNRFRRTGKAVPASASVRLPWGAVVTVHTGENVGRDIYHYCIFDKIVPEAIWRLMDPGEVGIDIGANIGQNSSALAFKSGPRGRVISFEPHPDTFSTLKQNAANWQSGKFAPIELNNVALSEADGEAVLVADQYLSGASLEKQGDGLKVPVRRLDDFLKDTTVGVCKLDVEGHELPVLKGAQNALQRRAIRDIVFEDFNPKPSPITTLLSKHGFALFELHEKWFKPCLIPLGSKNAPAKAFSFNYLATLDAPRAIKRFRAPFWQCLLTL
jgi:FkbM family methyltransferase